MEELRASMPVSRKGLYAAAPGTGPDGKTCHDCAFLRYTGNVKKHPKCGKVNYTHGDATTILTRTPACKHFEGAT
jgi:hypothetical protein